MSSQPEANSLSQGASDNTTLAGPTRVLCLGNELVADDGLGPAVAQELRRLPSAVIEVAEACVSGFNLLDHILNAYRLIVVDTVLTGAHAPGSILQVQESDIAPLFGPCPHYIGLIEALSLARTLELPVPTEVAIIAVEAADCSTVGGAMHPAVRRAVSKVAALVQQMLAQEQGEGSAKNQQSVLG